jgi:MYXO-CTERM domain-containing protein
LWSLPLLEAVQFPYRVLPLAEFGIGTAIALFPGRRRFLALALFPPLALSSLFVAAPADESAAERLEALRYSYPDVPENLPPGKRPYSFRSQWAADIAAAHKRPKLVEDRTNCTQHLRWTDAEKAGALTSALALLLALGLAVRRRRRRAGDLFASS